MKLNNRFLLLLNSLLLALLMVFLPSCGIYSFTGAEIVGETISVNYFPNKAPQIQASLSQVVTDAISDKFVSQSKLNLVNGEADLHIEGEIVGYSVSPVAFQGNEQAARNRLTIQVNVRFTNRLKEKDNFEQLFSSFAEFDSQENLSSVQDELISQIVKRIAEDVFNKAVVNW